MVRARAKTAAGVTAGEMRGRRWRKRSRHRHRVRCGWRRRDAHRRRGRRRDVGQSWSAVLRWRRAHLRRRRMKALKSAGRLGGSSARRGVPGRRRWRQSRGLGLRRPLHRALSAPAPLRRSARWSMAPVRFTGRSRRRRRASLRRARSHRSAAKRRRRSGHGSRRRPISETR